MASPSIVFGISYNDNWTSSSILRPLLQNWLAPPQWHAWQHPCSCWHEPVPGRKSTSAWQGCQASPVGCFATAGQASGRNVETASCNQGVGVQVHRTLAGSLQAASKGSGRLARGCWGACVEMACGRPRSLMDVRRLVANDWLRQSQALLTVPL